MKKIILFTLMATLFITTFSGCSPKPKEETTATITPSITPSITPTVTPASLIEQYVTVNDDMTPVSKYANIDNTKYGFGFKKEAKGKIPGVGPYSKYLEGNNAVYVGDTNEKKIYLTFDEGYENGYTAKILDVLKEKKCPATFFVTGDYLKRNDELIARMINEGHIIGNHTWNHPSMPKVTDEEKFKEELTKIDDYLYEKHGIKTKYFRYPSGEFSEKTIKQIGDMGYKSVFWSLAYKDWEKDVSKGAENAISEVTNHIHNGAIILLHAVSKDNADALGKIIDQIRSEGYEIVSLDELKF